MRKLMLILVVLALSCSAYGQQVGASWTQKYTLWGFELYDEDYVHPGAVVELEGVELSAVAHVKDNDDWEKWDTKAGIKLPVGGLYVAPGYGYYILPGDTDVQEASLTVGVDGRISPRYTLGYIIPESGDEGQVHNIGLDVDIGELSKGIAAVFSADATYNDGVNPMGGAEISDWTHATARLELQVPVADFTVRPAVIYQHSFEPELLGVEEDEVWAAVSIVRKF